MGTAGLNHAYRFVWSDSRQGFVAVAELPRSSAKGTGKAEAIVVAVLGVAGAMGLSGMAHAADLPTGGQVVAGSGSITHSGKTLTVTQTSGKLAADWQSFNIGAGHTVNFVQPSASAVALNRVLGSNVSVIQGALNANGHVFLVNPNGVLFSPTAQVNVGALTASTLNLSNDDFMAGNYRFSGSSTAGVRNEGSITAAHGGTVALIAARIENIGQITADQGQVLLGAGNTVRLDLGGPVKLEVQESALNALIEQGGGIRADGGLVVYLTAKAAGELASSVINHSGITEARTLASGAQGEIILSSGYSVINTGKLDASAGAGTAGGQITVNAKNIIEAGQYDASGGAQGGRITLAASHHIEQTVASTLAANAASGPAGSIRIEAGNDAYLSGTASANGTGAGAKGGEIALTAPKLVVAGASLSATGEAGGGRIRVGGGWQGGDADLANAQSTYVVASTLDVSATVLGAGGTAVLWSEAATTFGGGIKAMGGTVAGDGGQVEISSRDQLTFGGTVDAKAFNGQNGRLLLDPKNIDIVESVSGVSVLSLRDPTPGANEEFGGGGAVRVVELMNGDTAMDRIAVASPLDSTVAHQAGAVHLYNSQTGALLSTLTGSQAGDKVGTRVTALANGHYVVSSSDWANGAELKAGAATWGNGATGLSGTVSAANSLVGSKANDQVGKDVTALTNGHYVVSSIDWANGAASQAGAATWGNGSTGVKGVVSVANSLVGSKAGDKVGNLVLALTNGHYVVGSRDWGNGAASRAGAATWGSGTTGVKGVVSAANSLVGTQTDDRVGERLTALTNGNYVVSSLYWANGSLLQAGAVTWGNGTTGVKGVVSAANSLVSDQAFIHMGGNGVFPLTNGNYVVASSSWANGAASKAGAVTWGNGTTGVKGLVSAANSLVGTQAGDRVSLGGVAVLSNGHYVVGSPYWRNGAASEAGAATWGNGTTGLTGPVSAANSLVGTQAGDLVGNRIAALTNGNYVVSSSNWANGAASKAGAATWGNGTTGVKGVVSAANSLVGSQTDDYVGGDVMALTNGHYVVRSFAWANGAASKAGAATWGNGTTGITGTVSAANSLVGTQTGDGVGGNGIIALPNGHYVVSSASWANGAASKAGAATWGNGTTGITGTVSAANSLVGTQTDDNVGNGITALTNGDYVVRSSNWSNGSVSKVGAVTWGNGATGISGEVSAANSLIGDREFDQVGNGGVMALSDGRALVRSPKWDQVTPTPLTDAGRVDILSFVTDGGTALTNPHTFALNPSGNSTLLASDVLALLNAGTAVTLQANNDITLSTALAVNNTAGNGGDLTLQAGRSILLNADLSTDNGNLTLTANETAANGVVNAHRDAGAAVITQAAGTTINAGTGIVSIALKDGAGLTHNTAGAITLGSITAGSLSVDSVNFSATATASDKTYDGTTAAALTAASLSGLNLQAGSNLAISNPSAGSFANKNAATGINVTSGAFTLSGYNGSASSSLLKSGSAVTAATTANITPKALTVTGLSADEKTYDGTTAATVSGTAGVSGLVGAETVNIDASNLSAVFADKNAGTAKAVTVSGITLSDGTDGNGGLASNYSVSNPAGVTGNILQKALTVTGMSASNRAYDGTTDATLTGGTLVGLVGSESLDFSGHTGAFDDKNAGANKEVTVTGIALADGANGGAAANYSVSNPTGLTADITQKALTVTGMSASSRAYDGTTDAILTGGTLVGLVGSESLDFSGQTGAFADKNAGTAKAVAVTGITLADGTDGNGGLASNYSVSNPADVTGTITRKALTVTGLSADEKTYDGTTAATVSGTAGVSGLVGAETVNIDASNLSAVFADKNAGSAKAVTVSGITLADGTDGNGGLASNYSVSNPAGVTGNILQKALTVAGMSASSRVYDGTTDATLTGGTLVGLVGSESLDFSGHTGAFDDKNAGTNKAVTVTGIALADGTDGNGGLASNYSVSNPADVTGDITRKALTVTGLSADEKTYDGTTDATLTGGTLVGLVGSESLGFSGQTGAFDDKNAGTDKAVAVTGIALADGTDGNGGLASNYSVSNPADVTGTITRKALTVTGLNADEKTYDGTTAATVSGTAGVSGLVGAETVNIDASNLSAVFADKNAGSAKAVTVNGITLADGTDGNGGLASNYSVSNPAGVTGNILQKALTVTGMSASSRVYDGSTDATLTGGTLVGLVGSESLDFSGHTGAFDTKNAGANKTVTVTGIALADGTNGGEAANYSVSNPTGLTADITQKALTVTGMSASSRAYDGTTDAVVTGGTLVGLVAGESLVISGQTGAFDTKNAGTGKAVTVSGTTLVDATGLAANYSVSNPTDLIADITPKALTVAGMSASDRAYDGTTDATLTGGTLVGLVGSESLDFSGHTGAFDDKNAGTNKAVTVTGIALADGTDGNGGLASNYSVSNPADVTGTITRKALTVTGLSADEKTYDGTTDATLTGGTLVGLVGSESLDFSGHTGAFDDKNAGTAKAVTVNGIALSDGANGGLAANYSVSNPTGLTADITQKALTVTGMSASSRAYDGTTDATLTGGTLVGLVGSESLGFSGQTGAFDDKNAGTDKAVAVTGIALADGTDGNGGLASNYSVSNPADVTGTITRKALTVTGLNADEKTYDGTTAATLSGTAGVSGLVGAETVNIDASNLSAVFADKNAGSAKAVTVNGITLADGTDGNGGLASNYSVSNPAGVTGNILQKALTVTGMAASNKTYDGTTDATLTGGTLVGLVDGESLAITGQTGAFDTKNAGTGRAVTVSGTTLVDATGLAANYSVSNPTGLTADITARGITVTADAKSKTAGGVDPALTYQVTAGSLVVGESLEGALSRAAGEAVGTYAIDQGSVTDVGNPNYQIAYVGADLTVNAAPATGPSIPQAAITVAVQAASQIGGGSVDGGAVQRSGGLAPLFFEASAGGSATCGQSVNGGLALMDVADVPADNTSCRDASGVVPVFVVRGGINVGAVAVDADTQQR